ncbi:MAG: DUF5712 family protein [Janthinobacterium lividum]
MYAKVINPKTNGKKVYDNKGSSARLGNYLAHEAKEAGQVAAFFGVPGSGEKTLEEVVALIDNNVKGLGKDDSKFYSLVLSPSPEELTHMGNDAQGLEKYTQNVMELYAKNFTLKGGRELSEPNLVWAATIHDDRKNRGTDEGVQGQKKDGLQTHIHIVVSARDADQKVTLNPLGTPDRFNRVQFQANALAQFDIQFGVVNSKDLGKLEPTRKQLVAEKADEITTKAAANKRGEKPLTEVQIAAKDARLDTQVARVNSKLHDNNQLDSKRVKEIAKERKYDNVFYATLGQIERNAEKGTYTPGPYQYLATGRVVREPELRVARAVDPMAAFSVPAPKRDAEPNMSAGLRALEQSIARLSRALAPKSKTQDVRSDTEKEQDHEYEY